MEDVNIGLILVLVEENKSKPEWSAIGKESFFFKTVEKLVQT